MKNTKSYYNTSTSHRESNPLRNTGKYNFLVKIAGGLTQQASFSNPSLLNVNNPCANETTLFRIKTAFKNTYFIKAPLSKIEKFYNISFAISTSL